MAYRSLTLNPEAPQTVKDFIRYVLEGHHFNDIRTMLRLPMATRGLHGGCNFTSTAQLLLVVGGISTVLYSQRGGDREKFIGLLVSHYPWKHDKGGSDPDDASRLLYDLRNALAHALGIVNTRKTSRRRDALVMRTSSGRPVGILKNALTRWQVEKLEQSQTRPTFVPPTVSGVHQEAVSVCPETLYWGVRQAVISLMCDDERMRSAQRFLLEEAAP